MTKSPPFQFLRLIFFFLLAAAFGCPATSLPQASVIIRPEFSSPLTGGSYNLAPKILKRPKIGLVLSGGGARGIAHVGVLKVLEENNIPIDFIAGNSIGAIVGGLYASGYSVAELESLVLNTNWNDVLSLTEDTRRTELYLEQKQAQERSFLLIRLEGLQPVIPSSLSSGQRLTNYLTMLTLQALYHPVHSFDDLKIPFRAVATDLVSGQRAVLKDGSLAEALRASVTVPLLFSPLERDSMSLVDGGLVSNAPVDLARSADCDIVITSNTTSGMRQADQLDAPWETADQIMNIMMQFSNDAQLKNSDIVIAPPLGNHLSSDFSNLDSLILLGSREAISFLDSIRALVAGRTRTMQASGPRLPTENAASLHSNGSSSVFDANYSQARVSFDNNAMPESIRQVILQEAERGTLTGSKIREELNEAFSNGRFADIYAAIEHRSGDTRIDYHSKENPILRRISFYGNNLLGDSLINAEFRLSLMLPIDYRKITTHVENLLAQYRNKGFSLARIDSLRFDDETGTLEFIINEGIMQGVMVRGNIYTKDYVIRREFQIDEGKAFNIKDARRGMININSTGLFEYVLLDIQYVPSGVLMIIKVKERGVNNVRLGVHADNERGLQGSIDLRDPNLLGTATELGFTFASGLRNRQYRLEYRANRVFDTYVTFGLRSYYRFDDIYTYDNVPSTSTTRWERSSIGEYREVRYGGEVSFGAQLERLGNLTTTLRDENIELKPLSGSGYSPARSQLVSLKLGTTIDTEDRYAFPTSGIMLNVSYESAMKQLGSEVSFGKLLMVYENFITLHPHHTIRPKLTIGVADATLPFFEQFMLGGSSSFFGLRDNDSRGRQLFLVNFEYRIWLPFKLVFESYFKLRYDLGMISSLPEDIQLGKFHHGLGAELAVDTPMGPASFGAGTSFFIRNDLSNKPISYGPILFYFSIGYGI